jgi:hypothetical protein
MFTNRSNDRASLCSPPSCIGGSSDPLEHGRKLPVFCRARLPRRAAIRALTAVARDLPFAGVHAVPIPPLSRGTGHSSPACRYKQLL